MAWAVKKADTKDMACSAADDDALAGTVCDGPARPRALDVEAVPSCTPSKSGIFGGKYFVASPAAYNVNIM